MIWVILYRTITRTLLLLLLSGCVAVQENKLLSEADVPPGKARLLLAIQSESPTGNSEDLLLTILPAGKVLPLEKTVNELLLPPGKYRFILDELDQEWSNSRTSYQFDEGQTVRMILVERNPEPRRQTKTRTRLPPHYLIAPISKEGLERLMKDEKLPLKNIKVFE